MSASTSSGLGISIVPIPHWRCMRGGTSTSFGSCGFSSLARQLMRETNFPCFPCALIPRSLVVRLVQKLYHMHHTPLAPLAARCSHTCSQLQQAARVGRQNRGGASLVNSSHLACEQTLRHIVLRHIINAGATAANF